MLVCDQTFSCDISCSSLGLASQHAYAVLDVVEAGGRRLVKLMNPWRRMRWKGEFSPQDETNWTPALRAALKYDVDSAQLEDNGVFWISWEAVQSFFSSIHCSWSPARFKYRRNVHGSYQNVKNQRKCLDDNPQYVLHVRASTDTMVWVLLDRHYLDTKDEPHIALHVYQGNRRVYYPVNPLIHSVYNNNPHFLIRLNCRQGENTFILVVSMYDEEATMNFTLTSYSADPSAITPVLDSPAIEVKKSSFSKIFRHNWTKDSAGGSINTDKFDINPMFRIDSQHTQRIFIKVRPSGNVSVHVGMHLFVSGDRVRRNEIQEITSLAGETQYRSECIWREYQIAEGSYTLAIATFEVGHVGEFLVTIKAENEVKIAKLPPFRTEPAPEVAGEASQPDANDDGAK
eukprot:759911-Hanusia_phi.AAC.10